MTPAADLAAQLRALADQVAALDTSGSGAAVPTGLKVAIGADMRPVLTWDPAADATSWDVGDQNNPAKLVQETVTFPRSVRSPLRPDSPPRAYSVRAHNAGGVSPWCVPVVVPAGPTTPTGPTSPTPDEPIPLPLPPARFPGDICGRAWKLTLPTGKPGVPDEVLPPRLATFASKYFDITQAKDGIIFRVWHGGVSTKGSLNPRSELRELNAAGSLAAWSCTDGRHALTVTGQVNRLTRVKPHVVIAQIHDDKDDVTVWRVEGDKLYVTAGDDPHAYLVDSAFELGKRYSIGFEVVGGKTSYRYNNALLPFTLDTTATGCYFKAGLYAQTNPQTAPGESTDEYDEVCLYSVAVTHSS